MALYAIGDIHGCLNALQTIFNLNVIKNNDTVVFLGDYIDRGPDSKGVIDWLIKNKNHFHFEFILGNHEIMMSAAKQSPEMLIEWLQNGGDSTLESYKINNDLRWADKIPETHWEFIENCRSYLEIDNYIFVHAGLEKGKDLNEQNKHHLFWKKYEIPEEYDPNRKVICGHTSRKNGEIANFGHTICIDTYAYGGKWLTCLNVETNEYIKSNNTGEYEKGKLR
jgi:serine/threonine protein phosphatase 1